MSLLTLEAKLERSDSTTPWGFRMQGGKDFSSPLTIQRVNPGSLAAKCGLQTGDIILRIGNEDTSALRHKEAQNSILAAGNRLDLLLQRIREKRLVKQNGGGAQQRAGESNYQTFSAPTVSAANLQNAGGYNPSQSFNAAPKPFGSQQPTPAPFRPTAYEDGLSQRTQNLSLSPGNAPPAPQFGKSTAAPKPASTFQPKPAPAAPMAKTWTPSAPAPVPSSAGPRPFGGGAAPKPTGVGAKRGRVGEAVTNPGGTGRIPVCSGCSAPIRGPFVTAMGNCWCPDHFVCANPQCGVKLIDIGFVEDGGNLYCERDYERYLAPHCKKCNNTILGECVNALQSTWHPDCFLCSHCKKPIGGNQFHIEDGKPFCEKDWAAMFQTMCASCDFPIEPGDRWVEAMGKNFHAECFNCATCQVSLEGQPFVAKAGKAYCKKHAR